MFHRLPYRWLAVLGLLAGGAFLISAALQVTGAWLDHVGQQGPTPFDDAALRWCQDHYHRRWHRWAYELSALGSTIVLTLVVSVVVVALLLAGHRRLPLLVLITSLGASLLITNVKERVERPRPPAEQHLDPFVGASFSFPSGHALGAMAIYANLGLLLARLAPNRRTAFFIRGTAIGLALVIGLTRIYLRVHYPTDVLAGWLAGLAWLGITTAALHQLHEAHTATPRPSAPC